MECGGEAGDSFKKGTNTKGEVKNEPCYRPGEIIQTGAKSSKQSEECLTLKRLSHIFKGSTKSNECFFSFYNLI